MYITLEKFYQLFTYLAKFNFGTDSFTVVNMNHILKLLSYDEIKTIVKKDKVVAGNEEDIKGFYTILNIYLQDYKEQYKQAEELNKKYAEYCDPQKFEVLRDSRPQSMKEKYKVDFFENKGDYDRNSHYLLCVLTDLYGLGLAGLEKTLTLIDAHLAIIRVQKAKLDSNQSQYEKAELKKP